MARDDVPGPMRSHRRKALRKAQGLLGAESIARTYAFGVTGPEPVRSLWLQLAGVVAACALLAFVTGFVLIPGVMVLLGLRWFTNRPLWVVVADRGVATMTTSFVTNLPTRIVGRVGAEQLGAIVRTTRARVRVTLGDEPIWLHRREYEILRAAQLASSGSTSSVSMPAG